MPARRMRKAAAMPEKPPPMTKALLTAVMYVS
jgi:hypothetical protein